MGYFYFKLLVLLCFCFSFLGQAAETGVVVNSVCIGDLDQAASSKNYIENVRKLAKAQKLSAEDILARLIFSEGLATGCLRDEECNSVAEFKINIFTKIGWSIAKSFKNKANQSNPEQLDRDIYNAVFKRQQFRISFTPKIDNKTENIYAQTFICPERIKSYLADVNLNYLELLKAAQEVAVQVSKNPIIGDYRFVTNIYYPKSPVFEKLMPKWAKNIKPIIGNKWISMYHVSESKQPQTSSSN